MVAGLLEGSLYKVFSTEVSTATPSRSSFIGSLFIENTGVADVSCGFGEASVAAALGSVAVAVFGSSFFGSSFLGASSFLGTSDF